MEMQAEFPIWKILDCYYNNFSNVYRIILEVELSMVRTPQSSPAVLQSSKHDF